MYRDREGWRVQWRENGRRRSRVFEAKGDARKFELELELGIADVAPTKTRRLTFGQYAERWLAEHVRVEKARSQWAKDEGRLKRYLLPAFGDLPLDALRQSHLLTLKADLLGMPAYRRGGRGLSKTTANLVLVQAKQMLSAAVARELLPANPWAAVKLHKVAAQDFAYWVPDERDVFLEQAAALDGPFTRLVAVACHTGLRLGELAALTRRDLDFDRNRIRIRGSFDFESMTLKSTKGGEVADVPMNAAVREALAPLRFIRQQDQLVFDRSMFWSARKRLGRLAKAVGVTPIRFHDLRHTFASCLAMAGVDLLVIQQLMRHKSYQMTLRYAHLHPSHLAGATDVLCGTRGTQPARNEGASGVSRWAQRDSNPQPSDYECLDGGLARSLIS